MNSENTFLGEIARHVLINHRDHLEHLTIILPNNRAKLFFLKYLAEINKEVIWIPKMMSSREFIETVAGVKIADDVFLMVHLYTAWKESVAKNLTFFQFLNHGPSLLRDFSEIDQQVAATDHLFSALGDIRTLEAWSPSGEGLSEQQKKYLEFCKKLPFIYHRFVELLLNNGIAYPGLAERLASNKDLTSNFSENHHFIIAGFNAMTGAEEQIFDKLRSKYAVEFFWDYDNYYLKDLVHEAGFFPRKNLKKYPNQKSLESVNNFTDIPKNIMVYQCTTPLEQALVANNILGEINDAEKTEYTALVLADEAMLAPVLQYLPDNIKHVNVTMGYPLKFSPFHALFEAIIRMYFNLLISGKSRSSGFYFKDVIRLLLNNMLAELGDEEERKSVTNLLIEIREQNIIYLPASKLNAVFFHNGNKEQAGFKDKPKIIDIIGQLKSLVIELDQRLMKRENLSNKMSREFLLHHAEVIGQVEKFPAALNDDMDIRSFYKIWKQYVQVSKVQFTGEPLLGLQIMGLLETRNLDFENVIILSTNEGIIPSSRSYSSLLPNDLKKSHGLLIHEDREAIYSHHFYRLLQRANNIHLVYFTQSQDIGSAEKSRFINQLKKELITHSANNSFDEKTVEIPFSAVAPTARSIVKTKTVCTILLEKFSSGLSPTAFSTYLNCPMDFYYKYLVGLREEEDPADVVEANVLGTVLHEALEELYKPMIGKSLTTSFIKLLFKQYESVVLSAFERRINRKYLFEGKNLLTYNIACKYLEQFLHREMERLENESIELVALEEKISFVRQVTFSGEKIQLKLKGIIDRVENVNGVLQVIDYKTGRVDATEMNAREMNEVFFGKKNKLLQLMMYAWMLSTEKYQNSKVFSAKVYALRSFNQGYFDARLAGQNTLTESHFSSFEIGLEALVNNMLDTETPFEHNHSSLYCNFC